MQQAPTRYGGTGEPVPGDDPQSSGVICRREHSGAILSLRQADVSVDDFLTG